MITDINDDVCRGGDINIAVFDGRTTGGHSTVKVVGLLQSLVML